MLRVYDKKRYEQMYGRTDGWMDPVIYRHKHTMLVITSNLVIKLFNTLVKFDGIKYKREQDYDFALVR